MDQKRKLAAQKLLDLARRELVEMDVLFERDLYYGAANRAYYAVFHAASALLMLDGKRFKKHSAVKSCFGKDYVKTKIVPDEYHELFENLLESRHPASQHFSYQARSSLAARTNIPNCHRATLETEPAPSPLRLHICLGMRGGARVVWRFWRLDGLPRKKSSKRRCESLMRWDRNKAAASPVNIPAVRAGFIR